MYPCVGEPSAVAGGGDGTVPASWAIRAVPWSWRLDAPLAGLLAVTTLVHRLSQAANSLYTVDSVLFSLATERYDLLALRPHPPGYPLFIAIGKALLGVTAGDPNRAFVMQASLWSAVAVGLIYALARAWGSRRAAFACAVLFAAAPAFVLNGTIALSYTAEAAAMVGVGLAAWTASRRPDPPRLLALGAAWAIAVGIRQSLFLFLAPVVAYALLHRLVCRPMRPTQRLGGSDLRTEAMRIAIAAFAAALVAAAWFVPTLQATGGWTAWRHATRAQSQQVVFADSAWARGWPALHEHVGRLAYFLHWEAGLAIVVVAAVLIGVAVRQRGAAPSEPGPFPVGVARFLVAWLAPALLFYLVVFDGWERGPVGYVLTVLPGLYIVGVLAADHGLRRLAASQPVRLAPLVRALSLIVLLVPLPGLAADAGKLVEGEAHTHDRWTEAWQRLEVDHPANETAILTWQSWAHVEWYFPEHLSWTYFPSYRVPGTTDWALVFAMQHHEHEGRFIEMYEQGPGRAEHPVPPHIKTIVLFDFQLAGEGGERRRLDPALEVNEERLSNGWRILLVRPDAAHPTVESLFTPAALGVSPHSPS